MVMDLYSNAEAHTSETAEGVYARNAFFFMFHRLNRPPLKCPPPSLLLILKVQWWEAGKAVEARSVEEECRA